MVDTAALLARIKQQKAKYSRSVNKTVRPKEGKTRIRLFIAPSMSTDDHPFGERDLGVHWIKTQVNGKPVAVIGCQEIVYDKPSLINPIIDQAARAAVDDETLAIVKEWKARKSVLINAIIRDGADASEKPQILELTPTTWGNVLSILESYIEDGRADVLDPKSGVDLIIQRTGKGFDTEYTVMVAPSSKPIDPKIVNEAINLDDFIANEFFKGEEQKAINAMTSAVGLDTPTLAAPRAAAMLTSARPVEAVDAAPVKATASKPTAAAAPAADEFGADLPADQVDAMLAELDNL